MSPRTCDYVARRSNPESWHGTESSTFHLDYDPSKGGLGIEAWHCPHPPLDRDAGSDDADDQYCVFHTDPADVPNDIDEREALLNALQDAGNGPRADRPEHRGQFVGATFGAIDLSNENIEATDHYDIRLDHALFRTDDRDLNFENTTFATKGEHLISFAGATFITDGEGHVAFQEATFRTDGGGNVWFQEASLINANFQTVEFAEAYFGGVDLTGTDLREANVANISVNGATTCKRLNEGYGDNSSTGRLSIRARLRRFYEGSKFDSEAWDATARGYHQLKTVFGEHGLVGKARNIHVRERRARSLESRAANGRFGRRYLRSLPSRVFTGYGVQVRTLVFWMGVLFVASTAVYMAAGVRDTLVETISYSVLAFTVAPPEIPKKGVGTQLVMMIETFFGTLSIVLLGYILGNRERF